MKLKFVFLIPVFCLFISPVFGQDEPVESEESNLNLGADIVSRYVWRGMPLSTSPAIQPYLDYSLGGFTLGTWGSYTFSHEGLQEVDLFLTYTMGAFSVTVNDYLATNEEEGVQTKFFDWSSDSTMHLLEGVVAWEGTESFPLSVSLGVMLYGSDKNPETGNNYFSTYTELGYNLSVKSVQVTPFLGLTFAEGLYADGFNVVNLGIKAEKEIPVTDKYGIPISVSFITNPSQGDVFLVFALSF